ncbi:MAG: hypothetical protein ABSC31_13655 [Acidimicrobiales bacterium]|jgi:hypothetical protein
MLSSFLLASGGRLSQPTPMDLLALQRRLSGDSPPKVAVIRNGLVWIVDYVPSPPPPQEPV